VDLTPEAQAFAKWGGGFEKYVLNSAPVGGRYLGIPHGMSNASMNYRISWFKEAGVATADDGSKVDLTWDEYHEVAKKLKASKGKPFGQALGHSTGDPPGFCYPYMWAHGAMEISKDGKSIQFNKPQFVEGMRKFIEYWKDGYDTTGTSWDDSNNNRAFLSEQISCTYNGSSIYYAAKKDKPELAQDIHHMLIPKGPAGRFYWLGSRTFAILKNSKNVTAAKEFLKWWFTDEQYGTWWRAQEGYMLQAVTKYYDDPTWTKDPKMLPFREQPKYGVDVGWPGPPDAKASLAWSKYIVVDTFAKAVQSGDAKAAIEWGAEELKRVYKV
jgi:multiple sugar transport system substrate-binding protein